MNYVLTLLANVFFNSYFLLFLTAGLGMALGKIKIKGFTLGSTGGIFVGIFFGWLAMFLALKVPEGSVIYDTAQKIVNGQTFVGNLEKGSSDTATAFMMTFMFLFICAIGLSVGDKIKSVLNAKMLKLVALGIFIPVISMALTFGCVKFVKSTQNKNVNIYEIGGLYSGAMTNTAALGTSMSVVGDIDVTGKYNSLDDEQKQEVLDLIHSDLTTDEAFKGETCGEQIGKFKGIAKGQVSLGYAISFPVGTIVIILAITIISAFARKNEGEKELRNKKSPADKFGPIMTSSESIVNKATHSAIANSKPKAFFWNAMCFGLVMVIGIFIGNIKIPLGGSASFSLSPVGGILITAIVVGNFKKIGPVPIETDKAILGFIREFALLLFMSVLGIQYGYQVVAAFTGSGIIIALMAIIIEGVAIILSVILGRFILKMNWGLLCGAISGGCTSSVGLGASLNMIGGDEPTVGYGISQPFAILANVLLISLYHSYFFI